MADAAYDAIVIGGGTNGLIVGNYLAKYGGMKVAIFEARPELGGGWGSEETAGGFITNTHAANLSAWYTIPLEKDFPLKEKGFEFIPYRATQGAIFKEDHSCFTFYSSDVDPDGELTAKTLARFSSRDADTWRWLVQKVRKPMLPAIYQYIFNPPPPVGEPTEFERVFRELCREYPDRLDPALFLRSEIEVFRDLFESEAIIAGILRLLHSGTGTSPDFPGVGIRTLFYLFMKMPESGTWRGGTHALTHPMSRIFVESGGEFFTKSEVDKVLIQNGKARGIQLVDGTQVQARKLVVSGLDPKTLCFRLIGKEHLDWRLARRVANLERWRICITWYGWAIHELPAYKAAQVEPDINESGFLALVTKDPMLMVRNEAWRRLGREHPERHLVVWQHSRIDKHQAPEGKHSVASEEFVLPANLLTDDEWKEFKKRHAEDTIRDWQEYAPNMTWDNVIAYLPLTPLDATNCANFGPEGNWAVIDQIPTQWGSHRPVPELAQHRTPITGLYATGAGWHRGGGCSACPGYNCYKIIAKDFGLKKPWEEQGRPF